MLKKVESPQYVNAQRQSFDIASGLPDITAVTSSTSKFRYHVGCQIIGYCGLTRKFQNFERLKYETDIVSL